MANTKHKTVSKKNPNPSGPPLKLVDGLPFDVGDAVLIRTVTMIQLGRVTKIGADFFVLEDASWVSETDRFSDTLAKGTLREVERCPSWVLVGRGAIVDVFPWNHPLPRATK